MRNRVLPGVVPVLALIGVLAATPAAAEGGRDRTAAAQARDHAQRAAREAALPEHKRRPLPDEDTFTPSEKVPEDYPVPFPADI